MEPKDMELTDATNESLPLSDQAVVSGGTNIVHYQRRTNEPIQMEGAEEPADVLFIDESTPTPALPWPPRHVPFDHRRRGDDDVLYIGPE